MATVFVKLPGGDRQIREAATVGCLKKLMEVESYSAKVEGMDVDDDYLLEDDEFVTLAQPSKGGC